MLSLRRRVVAMCDDDTGILEFGDKLNMGICRNQYKIRGQKLFSLAINASDFRRLMLGRSRSPDEALSGIEPGPVACSRSIVLSHLDRYAREFTF